MTDGLDQDENVSHNNNNINNNDDNEDYAEDEEEDEFEMDDALFEDNNNTSIPADDIETPQPHTEVSPADDNEADVKSSRSSISNGNDKKSSLFSSGDDADLELDVDAGKRN